MVSFIEEYNKYFALRQFSRLSLFEEIGSLYGIKKALYLGSYVHVTPSLVYKDVAYIDSDKRFKHLTEDPALADFIDENKQYPEKPRVRFLCRDYEEPLDIENDFDLLISQYAGFISRSGKKYLRKGGVLVANDSHGDASMAYLDSDYRLIAVANHTDDKWSISSEGLDDYFVPRREDPHTYETLEKVGRGFAYKKSVANYIFEKIS